ncbi:MAG TPA: hypothetical protein ENG03_10015 [Thioploca sp.]|nr:MAG: hypothetical protein DRR19_12430 [Gammaproteobacteria bacterium]HDN27411.1 hypothetical protein [Thioploca sp.]
MTDKIYKLILLGKIAEGHDVEVAQDKLSIIFDIPDLKQIPKLLKKPTVIRKNLSRDVAMQYKTGLEKIGVLCDIDPPFETEPSFVETEIEPNQSVEDDKKKSEVDESDTFSLIEMENSKTLILDNSRFHVINIKIPFWSMIILVIKWTFASIPALIVLWAIGYLLQQAIGILGGLV